MAVSTTINGTAKPDVIDLGCDCGIPVTNPYQAILDLNADGYVSCAEVATADVTVNGLAGNDVIHGNAGRDRLNGDAGDDEIHGCAGNDTINGGNGNDCLHGDAGDDTVRGGIGDDKLFGGPGDDRLFGDAGNDQLAGGAGNDWLFGGTGNDVLQGGAGKDTLTGGSGRDCFDWAAPGESTPGANRDIVIGFTQGQDKLDVVGRAFGGLGTTPAIGTVEFLPGFNTILTGNVGGTIIQIQLNGFHWLTAADFTEGCRIVPC